MGHMRTLFKHFYIATYSFKEPLWKVEMLLKVFEVFFFICNPVISFPDGSTNGEVEKYKYSTVVW